ncbi:MAG: acyl-CoA dehydrogenase family protein [Burkholderiales bacterium]
MTEDSIRLAHTLDDGEWMNDHERSLFERARSLLPALAVTEATTRDAREVPAVHIRALHEAGLIRILQPKRFGGLQGNTRIFSRIVEELALGCSATAWVYAVFGEHQWVIACFPEQAQIDVWGTNPDAVASSSLVPRGTAQSVTGGYRLSGSYPFSSGCGHAQWGLVGAFCIDREKQRYQRYFLIPMAEIKVKDDWQVLGLEGTGSRSLVLEDVFVPEHRSVPFRDLIEGTPPGCAVHLDYPMMRAPRNMFAPFSQPPVVFALAQRLLSLVTEMVKTRVSRGVTKVADSEVTHVKLAESAAEIEFAVRQFRWRCERSVAALYSGAPIPLAERLATRRDIVYSHRWARAATERLCELAGATFVYDASPLQPIIRDIQTCLTHGVAIFESGMVPYGRSMLGMEAMPPA